MVWLVIVSFHILIGLIIPSCVFNLLLPIFPPYYRSCFPTPLHDSRWCVWHQCEFFLPLWWIIFFLSLKYFWALFRDIIKSWKWFAPFQSCLNTLVGRNRRAFSLGLISLHYQGKIFWILYLMPHERREFPVWLVRAGSFLALCGLKILFCSTPLCSSFHTLDQYVTEFLKGLREDVWDSPPVRQSFIWYIFLQFWPSQSAWVPFSVLPSQGEFLGLLGFLLSEPWATAWKCLQAVNWGNNWIYFVCFPFSQQSFSFIAWCPMSWEPLFHIFCPVF